MYRATTILKTTRLEKGLDYSEISKKLKIPVKYLQALETEDVSCFPPDPYCSLIVKDYATFLGLDGNNIASLFRRDFSQKRKIKSTSRSFFSFTPQFTFTFSVILLILLFSSYLIFEYIKYNHPPLLKINWPESTTATDISGFTDPEATIRINNDLIIIDPDGKFQKKITITPGQKITIESRSPAGKTTVEEKTF